MTNKENIQAALGTFTEPNLGTDLVSAKCVKAIDIDGGTVNIQVELGFPAKSIHASLAGELQTLVASVEGVEQASVIVTSKITSHSVQKGVKRMNNIKNIIAVASGKGGVGKSTTSVNLALALSAEGAIVGILDADIYGPSQPRMLGISGKPESQDGNSLEPMENYGLQAMSIGFLIDEETPMIWRGPMVTQALEQLLNDTQWRGLDYLIIDLPPGTGDTQLTLAQKIPVSGAVIVTTPQDIALLDARKGLKMFEKVEVPILGIVENMSTHICSQCGHEEHIFGAGGGASMAEQHSVDFLGSLPLDITIREHADSGKPSVVSNPDGQIAAAYGAIARKMSAKLAMQAKDYSASFPNIVIQNS